MRINFLYVLLFAAILGSAYLIRSLYGQQRQVFIGTAETEPRTLNLEHAVAVRACRVQVGDFVRRGDTLAILERSELIHRTVKAQQDQADLRTAQADAQQVFGQERQILLTRQAAQRSELAHQMATLRTEDSLKRVLAHAIYPDAPYDNAALRQRLTALQAEQAQLDRQIAAQISHLEARRAAQRNNTALRQAEVQQDLAFVAEERNQLWLLAPCDGFVEQLSLGNGQILPAYRDLVKINPQTPNRVIGFLYESADIPFRLGDTVLLESAVRTLPPLSGRITGSSPKLVELPYRLRKFTELRAWGREVYIQVPPNNSFYIGEKIRISLAATH